MGKDKRKPLVELDGPGGKIKQFWESGRMAANFYGFSPVYISQQLKGRISNAKKHYFRYATDAEATAYLSVIQQIEEDAPPVVADPRLIIEIPETSPEIIPESTEKLPTDPEELTPFDRLIKKGKEKLN